jgi:hypothetical protein
MRTTLEEACFTEVMTEVTTSNTNGLERGGTADRRSDAPLDLAIEMQTAVTAIATETAGQDTLEPMERNENGMPRRRSEVPLPTWALRDWRSRMERLAQRQACELPQLH